MDKFVWYSPLTGFTEFESSDNETAHQTCKINQLTFIGYKARLVQNILEFIGEELSR